MDNGGKTMHWIHAGVIGTLLTLFGRVTVAQTVLQVDSSPPGSGGWTAPYSDLSAALIDAAGIAGPKEIWVASGEYEPTEQLGPEPNTRTFVMRMDTRVFGGFDGNELNQADRNPQLNPTVLDGEIELPRPPSCDDPAPGAGDCFDETLGVPTCTEPE